MVWMCQVRIAIGRNFVFRYLSAKRRLRRGHELWIQKIVCATSVIQSTLKCLHSPRRKQMRTFLLDLFVRQPRQRR